MVGIDCQMKIVSPEERDNFFSEEVEERSLTKSAFSLAKQLLFYLTEIENFRPADAPMEQGKIENFFYEF